MGLVIRLGALILLAAASGQANAQTFTSLLSFTGTGGAYPGHYPGGDVTLSGTTLYGMTALGGSGGDGSVFSIGVDGTNYQNVLSFSGNGGPSPGQTPLGGPTLSGSTLYGMTQGNGGSYDGNVFSVGVNGTNYQNLLSFNGSNGSGPCGSLSVSGSTLYGMTEFGGKDGSGNLFSIGVNGTNYQNLLPHLDGFPTGSLTLSGSTLMG